MATTTNTCGSDGEVTQEAEGFKVVERGGDPMPVQNVVSGEQRTLFLPTDSLISLAPQIASASWLLAAFFPDPLENSNRACLGTTAQAPTRSRATTTFWKPSSAHSALYLFHSHEDKLPD